AFVREKRGLLFCYEEEPLKQNRKKEYFEDWEGRELRSTSRRKPQRYSDEAHGFAFHLDVLGWRECAPRGEDRFHQWEYLHRERARIARGSARIQRWTHHFRRLERGCPKISERRHARHR